MNLNITVPDHLVATADKLSKRMGVSRNELFRLALTQLLEELQSDSELVAAAPSAADDDEDW
jgi:metal-responsive CopG/Arc/MetJ family transcriptional regulator